MAKRILRRKHRRGIILLLVLSLLAVFVLVGATFVVVSSRFRQAEIGLMNRNRNILTPNEIADEAVSQLLRGTYRPSSLAGHDLLTDMWGNDGVRGIVAGGSVQANGQFLEISFVPDPQQPFPTPTRTLTPPYYYTAPPYYGGRFAQSEHAYAGSLATIESLMWSPGADRAWGVAGTDDNGNGATDSDIEEAGWPGSDDRLVPAWEPGPDGGWGRAGVNDDGVGGTDDILEAGWGGSDDRAPPRSTARIVDSGSISGTRFWIRVESFQETSNRARAPGIANRLVINGIAFNGTGVGFDPTSRRLNATLYGPDGLPGIPSYDDASFDGIQNGTTDDRSELGKVGILKDGMGNNQLVDDVHIAMLPHFRANPITPPTPGRVRPAYPTEFLDVNSGPGTNIHYPGIGGEDEDNDTPNEQNMYLAYYPANAAVPADIIPSYHRPQLMQFLRNHVIERFLVDKGVSNASDRDLIYERPFGLDPDNPADDPFPALLTGTDRQFIVGLKRMHVLRPLADDHPNFTGSNAALGFAQMNQLANFATWDVDNDGDDIPDSIWIDIGIPVSPGPDGKLRKTLVAILVKDLDGRLDLNTAGSFTQLPGNYDGNGILNQTAPNLGRQYNSNQYAMLNQGADGQWGYAGVDDDQNGTTDDASEARWPGSDDLYSNPTLGVPFNSAAGGNSYLMPRGLGMGPAETNIAAIFHPQHEFINVMTARYQSALSLPAWRLVTYHQVGSRSGNADPEVVIKHHGWPLNSAPMSWNQSGYGSFTDIRGEGSVYLDDAGLPITLNSAAVAPGPDGQWGVAGTDDDGNGTTDDMGEAGWPNSDDLTRPLIIDTPYDLNVARLGTRRVPMRGADGGWGVFNNDDDGNGVTDDFAEAGWPGSDDDDVDLGFGLNELERLLRWNDADAAKIPSVLAEKYVPGQPYRGASITFTDPGIPGVSRKRNLFTTMSSQVPVPSYFPTLDLRTNPSLASFFVNPGPDGNWGVAGADDDGSGTNDDASEAGSPGSDDYLEPPTLAGLYRTKLASSNPGRTDIANQLAIMLPFEVIHGMKLDINRAFGNGRDDDGDGLVDEPGETQPSGAPELAWSLTNVPAFQNKFFRHGNGDFLSNDDRQIFARHLFCLMMALIDHPRLDAALNQELGYRLALENSAVPAIPKRELTAHRIAQWCVNVVDFRDSDSIMTAFEYDMDPFNANGWAVDGWNSPFTRGNDMQWGIAGIDDDSDGTADNATEAGWPGSDDDDRRGPGPDGILGNADDTNDDISDRRLVWGCESPDLLMTETTAFHDRRVIDADNDNGIMQKRVDAMMNPADPHLDQYRIPQGSLFIELYCPSPRYINSPRTRTELFVTSGGTHALNLAKMASADSPVWRIAISEAHNGGNEYKSPYERRKLNPPPPLPAYSKHSVTFQPEKMDFLTTERLKLERFITFGTTGPATLNPEAFPNRANSVFYNRVNGALLPTGSYAVVGPRVNTFIGVQDKTGANYAPSTQRIELDPVASKVTRYPHAAGQDPTANTTRDPLVVIAASDPVAGWNAQATDIGGGFHGIGINVSEPLRNSYYPEPQYSYQTPSLLPRDSYFDPQNNIGIIYDDPFDSRNNRPLSTDGILGPNDNAVTNNVKNYKTAFLQRLANPTVGFHAKMNPYITVDWMAIDLTLFNGQDAEPPGFPAAQRPFDPGDVDDKRFNSRQRNNSNAVIWHQQSADPAATGSVGGVSDYFDHNLGATLGYLNSPYQRRQSNPYLGDPDNNSTFPWLTWHDRPFSNPMELLLVPASGPSRLLHEYSYATPYPANPYAQPTNDSAAGSFGHLLNFFQAAPNPAMGPPPPNSDFHRILDFVETPSRFVGTEKWYDSVTFQVATKTTGALLSEFFGFGVPFNRMSNFRDPGILNANTISDTEVWDAYMAAFPNAVNWTTFRDSRTGKTSGASYPSPFNKPFRSGLSEGLAIDFQDMRAEAIKSTLLRPAQASSSHLFDHSSANAYNHSIKNPHFRFEQMQRAGSALGRHSNVFAVWVTVGAFEVEPNPNGVDLGHPDGYRYGLEAGAENGTITRHRAFYILDRSLPVGFVPGEDLNSHEAVLLRRYIE